MLLLFASKLILHLFIFAIFFFVVIFCLATKIRKKLQLPTVQPAFLRLIWVDADCPRIEYRGDVDSTFEIEVNGTFANQALAVVNAN